MRKSKRRKMESEVAYLERLKSAEKELNPEVQAVLYQILDGKPRPESVCGACKDARTPANKAPGWARINGRRRPREEVNR